MKMQKPVASLLLLLWWIIKHRCAIATLGTWTDENKNTAILQVIILPYLSALTQHGNRLKNTLRMLIACFGLLEAITIELIL